MHIIGVVPLGQRNDIRLERTQEAHEPVEVLVPLGQLVARSIHLL